jgi:hypothetical protein
MLQMLVLHFVLRQCRRVLLYGSILTASLMIARVLILWTTMIRQQRTIAYSLSKVILKPRRTFSVANCNQGNTLSNVMQLHPRLCSFTKKTRKPLRSFTTTSVGSFNIPDVLELVLPDKRDAYTSFSPALDGPRTKLLNGLATSTAVDLSEGVRAIRIGNSMNFLGDGLAGDTIYERPFYPELVNAIRCANLRVLLLGNPGTGKSVFQFYLLARYLNPPLFKDVPLRGLIKFGSEAAPKVVIRDTPGKPAEVWFLEQRVVYSISSKYQVTNLLECFDPKTTLYFYEPGISRAEPVADEKSMLIPTLATMPPDINLYKHFAKLRSTTKVFMPVFKEEELVAIGRDMRARPKFPSALRKLFTKKAIRERFETHNGIMTHVLPRSESELQRIAREYADAFQRMDVPNFTSGTIEDQTSSAHLAIYDVQLDDDEDDNEFYNFYIAELSTVNSDVQQKINDYVWGLSMDKMICKLQSLDKVPKHFKSVVAEHLTSTRGVSWLQRSSTSIARLPLEIKLRTLHEGEVPLYKDMKPMELYTPTKENFPFCDLLYKENGPDGKLVCIRTSMLMTGQWKVRADEFTKFCKCVGLDASSSDDVDRISFVYCPNPRIAETAWVTFEGGVPIDKYTIWYVNTDFSSGI